MKTMLPSYSKFNNIYPSSRGDAADLGLELETGFINANNDNEDDSIRPLLHPWHWNQSYEKQYLSITKFNLSAKYNLDNTNN